MRRICDFCQGELPADVRRFCSQTCYWSNAHSRAAIEARFWRFVDRRGPDECWLWTGALDRGYGAFGIRSRRQKAHRVSLEIALGEALGTRLACHTCDNPTCVNPKHLYAGTQSDNVRDMVERKRHAGQLKTHCPKGHPYDAANTWLRKSGERPFRRCRTCSLQSKRARRRLLGKTTREAVSA